MYLISTIRYIHNMIYSAKKSEEPFSSSLSSFFPLQKKKNKEKKKTRNTGKRRGGGKNENQNQKLNII